MATGTRGSAGRGRRATGRNSGWLIVATAAAVAVVWLGALAFGLPGQRVAGATAADARTAPTTTTARASAAVSTTADPALTSAARPATTSPRATTSKPAPPVKTRTTTPATGSSATSSTSTSTAGRKPPSGSATLPSRAEGPVPGSTPAYGVALADDRSAFEIFQFDFDLGLAVVEINLGVITDVAFGLHHVENAGAQLRCRRGDLGLLAADGVADAGEHIAQRICH